MEIISLYMEKSWKVLQTDLDYIKNILEEFKTIPDEKFCIGTFRDNTGACCAVGHAMRISNNIPLDDVMEFRINFFRDWDTDSQLRSLSAKFIKTVFGDPVNSIATVNNAEDDYGRYTQETIKGRNIALLEDMVRYAEVVE
jgi:hypothetical protein